MQPNVAELSPLQQAELSRAEFSREERGGGVVGEFGATQMDEPNG